ncbi:biopolymer transport protein ExbB [Nitrobacter winogradskyi]|nr:tonB-system energizer ExbB [Nitrobacter winogradskyi]MCP1997910.1 biopolymer transport protein ExbB [Nitrobacter winogradskyi]
MMHNIRTIAAGELPARIARGLLAAAFILAILPGDADARDRRQHPQPDVTASQPAATPPASDAVSSPSPSSAGSAAPSGSAPAAAASSVPASSAPSATAPSASAPSATDGSAGAASSQPSVSTSPEGASDASSGVGSPSSDASAGASSDAAAPLDQSTPAAAPPAPEGSSSTLPQDLSPWGMFMQADIVVKAVMIGLAFASLVTWTVWLAKGIELAASRRRAQSCVRKLERADSLDAARAEIAEGWTCEGTVADLMTAAERELQRSGDLSSEGIKERLAIALSRIEAKAGRDIARGTGLLATIGATAPFVGLFGTVWGIMNAFIGISQTKTTNLAVVAPGIAEALLATALGLVAAIPAVIIYNVFARALSSYRALLSDASGEIVQHISRDLERQERGLGPSVVALSRGRSAAE